MPLGILKASADVEGRDGFEEEIDPQTVVGVVPCWVAGEGAVEEKIVIVRESIVIVKVVRVEFAGRDDQGILEQMLLPPELDQ